MAKKPTQAERAEDALREFAMAFPGAHEDFPWGHRAIKVRGKIFVSMGSDSGTLRMSLKLRESNREALLLPFTEPTHYGMGKHGWVTSSFPADTRPPLSILYDWIVESYRLVAPKKLVEIFDAGGTDDTALVNAPKAARSKKKTSKKTSKKKDAAKKKGSKKKGSKKKGSKKKAAKKAAKKSAGKKKAGKRKSAKKATKKSTTSRRRG